MYLLPSISSSIIRCYIINRVWRTEISLLIFIVKALLIGYRREELACCVESLQLDLGLKSLLGFHHHINHLVSVVVPFLNAPEVSGAALAINVEEYGDNDSRNTVLSESVKLYNVT